MSTTAKRPKKPRDEKEGVLTLSEAAAFLRVSDDAVLDAVRRQHLPGRKIKAEWRFLKSALEDWLRVIPQHANDEGLAALAGAWKNDPHLEEMLGNIYRDRGRSMIEEAE